MPLGRSGRLAEITIDHLSHSSVFFPYFKQRLFMLVTFHSGYWGLLGNANYPDLTTNNPFDLKMYVPYGPLELSVIFGLMTFLV